MSSWSVLIAVVLASCGYVFADPADFSMCDPSRVGDLTKYYSNGVIPKDILSSLAKSGVHSYITLSESSISATPTDKSKSVCFLVKSDNQTVTVIKKMAVGEMHQEYTATEEDGMIKYKSLTDLEAKCMVYFLKYDHGVGVTFKCCLEGTGTTYDVGVFVCDALKGMAATEASLEKAMKMLKTHNLDANTVPLSLCSAL